MHPFVGIARDWLNAVSRKDLDLMVQVFESNSSDALADMFSIEASELDIQVFDIEFQPNMVADPLDLVHRILHWFGERYGHEEIECLIDRCVYSLHVDFFKAWYGNAKYYRKEPLLYEEAGYETQEFYLSLGRVLNRLARKTPFAVLIKNLDWASSQVLSCLIAILGAPNQRQCWGVIGLFEHARKIHRITDGDLWQDCLRQLERQGLVMQLPSIDHPVRFSWNRPKQLRTFEEQYRMLQSATDMFGFEDVIRIVAQVRRRYNDHHNGQLLFLSGLSSLMLRRIDDAVRDFNESQNRLQATKSESVLIRSNYWLANCYLQKSQEKLARAALEQCEKLALEYEDQSGYVLSQFVDFSINVSLAPQKITEAALTSLRFLLSDHSYNNLLALLLSQVHSQSTRFDKVSSRTHLRHCVTAIRISRQYRNRLAFSRALHAMGQVYLRIGNTRQTQRLYELSLSTLKRYQGSVDIVPLLNGLGYFLVSQEQWQKAWKTFEQAMTLSIKHRNFTEGCNTLYNYVWLYTQSGHIQRALDVINDLLDLLRTRNVPSVSVHNLKDLFIYKGWLHIQLRQPIQARYCQTQVQRMTELAEGSFSKVLYHLLSSMICISEKENDGAITELKKARTVLDKSTEMEFYRSSMLRLEIAHLHMELGQVDEAEKLVTQLTDKAHGFGLSNMAKRISNSTMTQSIETDSQLPFINQPYHVLMELARKENQLNQIQQELSDIHQVNLLVEMSANEQNIKNFLQQTIEVLDRRVPASDFGLLVESGADADHPIELFLSNNVAPTTKAFWREWLKKKPAKPQQFLHGNTNISAWPLLMGTAEIGWLIVSGDSQQYQVWNIAYLELVAQQLGLILDRRLREAYLEHRNKTDLLTGALNRAGLFERLKKQFAFMKRQPEQPFALCYFDLDHFKYFNDQFGHELGDRILQLLVKNVNSQLRGMDELGRVGGDEFIILLKDTDLLAVKNLLERLRASIAKPDWWLPLLLDNQDTQDNPIPKEEWISASFGVVVVPRWPKNGIDRIEFIAQGDAAMYEAKNNGRNCVVIRDFVESSEPAANND